MTARGDREGMERRRTTARGSKGKRDVKEVAPKKQSILLSSIPDSLPRPDVARLIPLEVAWELRAVPLAIEDGVLTVAMSSPDDDESIDAVIKAVGCEVFPVLSPPDQIESAFQRLRALSLAASCDQREPTIGER